MGGDSSYSSVGREAAGVYSQQKLLVFGSQGRVVQESYAHAEMAPLSLAVGRAYESWVAAGLEGGHLAVLFLLDPGDYAK